MLVIMARSTVLAKLRMLRSLFRRLLRLTLWFALISAALVLLLRWLPPPGSALMLERKLQSWGSGEPIDLQRSWRPWAELPDDLKIAVIAAEDQKFAEHWGFDLDAIQSALAHNERGGSLRGASTLSQQVAKNLFLWSDRSWLRKGLEVWFTGLIELCWSKQRILEVYLNTVEWGDGIFGAEAASQYFFHKSAAALTRREAILLVGVLPSPSLRNPAMPTPQMLKVVPVIDKRMEVLASRSACVGT